MTTDIRQDKAFTKDLFADALPDAVKWIAANMAPDEVFSEKQLDRWANQSDDWIRNED